MNRSGSLKYHKRLLKGSHIEIYGKEPFYKKIDPISIIVTLLILISAAFAILCFLPSLAHAQGLGRNDTEFQAIKARVRAQIKGSEATVSEVSIPKFNDADVQKINQARKQLASI